MKLAEIQPRDAERAARQLLPAAPRVAADLRALVAFAQAGAGAEEARERFARVMPALFAAPGDVDFDPMLARLRPMDGQVPAPVATALVVLRAVRGRLRLALEGVIEPADLAALCGVDDSYIRLMARQGRLKRASSGDARRRRRPGVKVPGRNAPITRASAEQLLGERGIAPYGVPS